MRIQVKPIILEAWLWDESKTTFKEIGCKMVASSGNELEPDLMSSLIIETDGGRGTAYVKKGNFIIKNIHGEYFVCDNEFFNNNYDII